MDVEYELSRRGDESFPFEYYYLDPTHPRYVMPYHWHMDYELVRVIEGTLALGVGNLRLELTEGDCVLVPPGAIHGSQPPTGTYECVVFDISRLFAPGSQNLKAIRSFWDAGGEDPITVKKGDAAAAETDRFFEAVRDAKRPISARLLLATGALLSVFGEFYGSGTHLPSSHKEKTERIKKVILYIRQNYTSHISLDDLSAAVGLNREYLCREFKAAIGMSPITFLIDYRIEQSKKTLLAPTGSVTSAALSSGFSDISYYIKKFTELNGCTPHRFRKSRRQ